MPSMQLVTSFLREAVSSNKNQRVPEPDLVMDDPDKVAAFEDAGKESGVMAPVYLFHAAQVSEVIKPGDTVIDLGCGPAVQLGMIARLNPQTNFIGVDLSDEMLGRAQSNVQEQNLQNVTLQKGDITRLSDFEDQSVDAIYSTVVLHHLPDEAALEKTFAEVKRILKPGGGLYLVDFGLLKSPKSIKTFAYQYADRQPELFTLDYLYSLQAAFPVAEYQRLSDKYFGHEMQVKSTFIMHYMVTVKSNSRADLDNEDLKSHIRELRQNMPDYHQKDLADLQMFFRLGGLKSPLLD